MVMRGPNNVIVADGMMLTRCVSSSTWGGSSLPAVCGAHSFSIGNPRLIAAYAMWYAVLPAFLLVSSRRTAKAGLGYCVSSQLTTASIRSMSAGTMLLSAHNLAVTSMCAML